MNKIQFNAKSFKQTRDIISAYFSVKFDLAIELDKAQRATSALKKVLNEDKSQLAKLAMGNTEGIIRTSAEIMESIKVNTASYNKHYAVYNTMLEKTEKPVADAIALFDKKDSALYKAYVAYVKNPDDDTYSAYAEALVKVFVGFGLTDATTENVRDYMVNADKERRGKSAVKTNDITDAYGAKQFSQAMLRKFYTNNRSAFNSQKFTDYVRKCAEQAKKN